MSPPVSPLLNGSGLLTPVKSPTNGMRKELMMVKGLWPSKAKSKKRGWGTSIRKAAANAPICWKSCLELYEPKSTCLFNLSSNNNYNATGITARDIKQGALGNCEYTTHIQTSTNVVSGYCK